MKKETLLKKLLKFILPISIIPIVVMNLFYYNYLTSFIQSDIEHQVKNDIIQIEHTLINTNYTTNHLKAYLEDLDKSARIIIYDKNLNIVEITKQEQDSFTTSDYKSFINNFISKNKIDLNGQIHHDYDNKMMAKGININNNNKLFILTNYNLGISSKLANINQTFLYMIFISLFVVFTIIILIVIYSLNIIEPIKTLTEGTKRVLKGDLDYKIEVDSDDEIGTLVKSFNKMTKRRKVIELKFKNLNNSLEQKVQQSTKQLIIENTKSKAIFNSQTSIVIITNGKNIKQINDRFFQIFDFKDMDDFVSNHKCICELFIKKEEIEHLQSIINGETWIKHIEQNPAKQHLAYMLDKNGNEKIFDVKANTSVSQYGDDKVAVFTDITDLITLQNTLQEQIELEVEKNRSKDIQLFNQSKMASMGDMIANIAHQWRQPLNAISTASSGLQIKRAYDDLQDEDFERLTKSIDRNTQYLSKTIDTFRNFLKEKKERKDIVLQERVLMALDIINAALKDNHIELIKNIDQTDLIEINMVVGELDQVIINIINNAKDILLEKNIDEPWIKISLENHIDSAIITIEDNAGGVPEDIISKIFEPYFTTKHKAQGTGLGLHMSYRIVKDSLNGYLYVNNTKNGAKFTIELPI